MPAGGATTHGEMQATLRRLAHEKFTGADVGDLLGRARDELGSADPDGRDTRLLAVTARDYRKATQVPAAYVAEHAQVVSAAQHAWGDARQASDFAAFRPHLEKVIALKRQYVELLPRRRPSLRRAARRLRARHDHRRRQSGVRGRAPEADCAAPEDRRAPAGGRRTAAPAVSRIGTAAVLGGRGVGVRLRLDARAAGQVHAPVRHRHRLRRRPHHDALHGPLPVLTALRDAARDRARALRAGRGPRAPSHATRRRRVARRARVAEPAVGEPRGPVTPVLGALLSRFCKRECRSSSAA